MKTKSQNILINNRLDSVPLLIKCDPLSKNLSSLHIFLISRYLRLKYKGYKIRILQQYENFNHFGKQQNHFGIVVTNTLLDSPFHGE